jgi:ubiquinone biosynthesis protein
MQWIDGIPASDLVALRAAGHNMTLLAERLIQTFLRHALRDGFFHADMHQGNLLIASDGTLVGIDLGINGRLSPDSRRFLAEILHGFIIRDYELVARVHFEAGYVPRDNNMAEFAQALRSIGEPIRDQNAGDISMAHLLNQLFEITEQFQMQTQPQLLLLQKTMVTVEGVARSFDPDLNFWDAASPVISDWLKKQLGPEAQLRSVRDSVLGAGRALQRLPQTLSALETASQKLLQDTPRADRMARWLGAIAMLAAAAAMALFWLAP